MLGRIWWVGIGVALPAIGAGQEAPAAACAAAAPVYVTATAGCAYGLPAISDEFLLVPKVCRHELNGAAVYRHAVEIRNPATGARVSQASLPPAPLPPAAPVPRPGVLLGGSPPLLLLPAGIASIDARKGAAEMVFEATGKMLAAARLADLLALAELLPAAQGNKPMIEWTVIDLEAGGVIGQAHVAGTAVSDLRLERTTAGLSTALALGEEATASVTVAAPLADAAGKSLVKDGLLAPAKQAAMARPSQPTAPTLGCPILLAGDRALAGRPAVDVRKGQAAAVDARQARDDAASTGELACVALVHTGGRKLGWWRDKAGDFQLAAAQCGKALPASAPPPTAPPATAPK